MHTPWSRGARRALLLAPFLLGASMAVAAEPAPLEPVDAAAPPIVLKAAVPLEPKLASQVEPGPATQAVLKVEPQAATKAEPQAATKAEPQAAAPGVSRVAMTVEQKPVASTDRKVPADRKTVSDKKHRLMRRRRSWWWNKAPAASPWRWRPGPAGC